MKPLSPKYPTRVAVASARTLGKLRTIHMSMPSFRFGTDFVDVAEIEAEDGTTAYVTAGLSEPGLALRGRVGGSLTELVLFSKRPDPRLALLLARIGGATCTKRFTPLDTLPLAGPARPFDAVLFAPDEGSLEVPLAPDERHGSNGDHHQSVHLLRVVGITEQERAFAVERGSLALLAALGAAGRASISEFGRATVPTLEGVTTFELDDDVLERLSPAAQVVAMASVAASGTDAELARDFIVGDDVGPVAELLGERLWHPAQLDTLLSALCDQRDERLVPVARRLARMVASGLAERDPSRRSYLAQAWSAIRSAAGDDFDSIIETAVKIRRDEDLAREICRDFT